MAKKLVSLLLALTLAVVCGAALAETTTTTGVAYGVYSNEGEHPDSLIRVTLTLDNGAITAAELDEKLIPVAMGGAAGWAELTDETAALLGLENTHCEAMRAEEAPAEYRDYTWTGAADEALGVGYTTEINGETVSFMDYVVTPEGGDWYFAQTEAALLNAAGETAATVEINNGMIELTVMSSIKISNTKTTPVIGALNTADNAPAAPQHNNSVMLR